jgi:hypothetical protein
MKIMCNNIGIFQNKLSNEQSILQAKDSKVFNKQCCILYVDTYLPSKRGLVNTNSGTIATSGSRG